MNETEVGTEEVQDEAAAVAEDTEVNKDIKDAFDQALGNESSEDDIKMDMIQAGATFKNVTRLYNLYMIDAGLAMSTTDRKAVIEETLSGVELDTEADFDAAVANLVEAVKGATERSAAAMVRAYGKKEDLEVFTKPKGEGGSRNPFVRTFHDALIEDPEMDEQGLKDLIAGLDETHRVNPTRWFSQHNNIRKTANAIAAKFAA